MSAGIQWDEPWSCHQVNLRPSVISQRSLSLVFRFTFLNWPVFSPGPALCASPAHECCSPAPRKIQARLRSQPCRVDRPHQGSHGDLGDPPCRIWVLPGYLANLQREYYKMYQHKKGTKFRFWYCTICRKYVISENRLMKFKQWIESLKGKTR